MVVGSSEESVVTVGMLVKGKAVYEEATVVAGRRLGEEVAEFE